MTPCTLFSAIFSSHLVLLALASPLVAENSFSWADTKYLVAFGDSYTYVQGTAGLQNFSFIHGSLNLSFTPKELLSNRILQDNLTSTAEGMMVASSCACFDLTVIEVDLTMWNI